VSLSSNPSTACPFPSDAELLQQLRQQLARTEQRLQHAELKIQQLEESHTDSLVRYFIYGLALPPKIRYRPSTLSLPYRARLDASNNRQLAIGMADEQHDRLEAFRALIGAAEEGAAIPPVKEDDLRHLHELAVDMTKRYSGKDGAVSLDQIARACSPGANLPAVWLRHTQLRLLVRQGLLAEWQHGTVLDDAVFRVAATIPMNGTEFDPEAFVRRLRYGTPP
jgi:hypothetical protein